MEQLSLKDEIRELILELKSYFETQYDIARLSLVETIAVVFTTILISVFISALIFASLLFFSFGLAFYLGKIWNSVVLGFIAVGGIYFLFTIVLYLLRNFIFRNPILKSLIVMILPKEPKSLTEEEEVS